MKNLKFHISNFRSILLALVLIAIAGPAFAAETSQLDTGNTAWILVSTALVLFMTLPGLALFYGGLVRTKNVLSVLLQCFAITGIVSLLWLIAGYSLAFADGNAFIGGLSKFLFAGVMEDTLSGSIPESLFALFQMTFAIITPSTGSAVLPEHCLPVFSRQQDWGYSAVRALQRESAVCRGSFLYSSSE